MAPSPHGAVSVLEQAMTPDFRSGSTSRCLAALELATR